MCEPGGDLAPGGSLVGAASLWLHVLSPGVEQGRVQEEPSCKGAVGLWEPRARPRCPPQLSVSTGCG